MIDVVKELRLKGLSARAIAKESGMSKYMVDKILRENDCPTMPEVKPGVLYDFLIGNIIGDGCIFGDGVPTHNFRMNLAHSCRQKDYFMTKYNMLEPIVRTKPTERSWVDKRTGNAYSEIRFQSVAHKFYTDLHKNWYLNGNKIINIDELKKCSEKTLAIKYFDDGTKGTSGGHYIAMHGYSKECVEGFRAWIFDEFGLDSGFHSGHSIYIMKKSGDAFREILSSIDSTGVSYKI